MRVFVGLIQVIGFFMLMHKTKRVVFGASFLGLSACVLTLSGCSFPGGANDSSVPQGPGSGFSSAENIAACSGKSEGDACEFPSRDGNSTVSGSCKQMREGDAISCMPDRPSGGNGTGAGMGNGLRNGDSAK